MVDPITIALAVGTAGIGYAKIGGAAIIANPIISAVSAGTTILAANVIKNYNESAILDQVGDSIGNIIHLVLGPVSKGVGRGVGSSAVDMVEGLGTSILSGVGDRIDRAGKYFEKTTLSKWFGEKNLSTNPDEYVDITQLAYRRFTDILSDNATTLTTLTGIAGLGVGAYLGHRALEIHQDKKGSEKEKIVYATSAGASVLISTYMLARAAFAS